VEIVEVVAGTDGLDYILENICRLDKEKDKQLISLIKEKIGMLRERGWVG